MHSLLECLFLLLLAICNIVYTSSEKSYSRQRISMDTLRAPLKAGNKKHSMDSQIQPGKSLNGTVPFIIKDFDFLSKCAGKYRLWVITAPSYTDQYFKMMEKHIEDMQNEEFNCKLAERDTLLVTLIHNAMMEGKLRNVSSKGDVKEEIIDQDTVTKLMHYLSFEEGNFGMLILKKNVQVGERFPYPVRIEAVLEIIDQLPLRKVEKLTRRGSVVKCKTSNAASHKGQRLSKRKVKVGGTPTDEERSSGYKVQRKQKNKEALKTKIQDILRGKSRFVIKRRPTMASPVGKLPQVRGKPFVNLQTNNSRAQSALPINTLVNIPESQQNKISIRERNMSAESSNWRINLGMLLLNSTNETEVELHHMRTVQQPENSSSSQANGTPERSHKKQKQPRPAIQAIPTILTTVTKAPNALKDKKPKKHEPKGDHKMSKAKSSMEKSAELAETDQSRKLESEKQNKGKGKKKGKKGKKSQRTSEIQGMLDFLEPCCSKRRILVITSPSPGNPYYIQQRDAILEDNCELAQRKITIFTLLGSDSNYTLKVDHYQQGDDDSIGADLSKSIDKHQTMQLLREHGMIPNKFFMLLMDINTSLKHSFKEPVTLKVLLKQIDSFPSRATEIATEKKEQTSCNKPDSNAITSRFLSRFNSKRRLLIISSSMGEDYSFQQQITAMNGQTCNLGIRHFALLKLVGAGTESSGTLELFPLNGKSQTEYEFLTPEAVKGIREHFKISKEYFTMLTVGKDGAVLAWYPTPVWSMSIIFEVIDNLQERRKEQELQDSLGIHCPEVEYLVSYHEYDGNEEHDYSQHSIDDNSDK
ncbi:coiled-coil domain-containing protein 80 [Polypterus senegalus]|uniref:coiled-coil domain-containing protein 80 n=1 Tax=Polypterus senegalus TaxID=55291 RepID=UPI001964DFC3|nr:coiled-coil domain-containing protein 80 [Polypterus senegalus]